MFSQGKTDSSQYSGVNPVLSDDEDVNLPPTLSTHTYDHPNAMGDFFERNLSAFSPPFVTKTPETGTSVMKII